MRNLCKIWLWLCVLYFSLPVLSPPPFYTAMAQSKDLTTFNAHTTTMGPFDFTRPPLTPRDDLDAYQWARVYITELHKPTFDKDKLNAGSAEMRAWWTEFYRSLAAKDLKTKISVVNVYLNKIRFTGNVVNDDAGETWATPGEFLSGELGHSGAHAILKYYALLALGVPEDSMCLAVVGDTANNRNHMLLIVMLDGSYYVLDEAADTLQSEKALDCYIPQYFVNAASAWLPSFNGLARIAYPQGQPFAVFMPSIAERQKLNSPLWDEQWQRVVEQEKILPTFDGRSLNLNDANLAERWARLYDMLQDATLSAKIGYVNTFFNQWKYSYDEMNWRQMDYWAAPREFMERGGDCEDYAIAKYYALRALGVSAGDMFLVWVKRVEHNDAHVVLVVLDGASFYVLDNNYYTNTIFRNGGFVPYEPLYYLNEYNAWRHMAR